MGVMGYILSVTVSSMYNYRSGGPGFKTRVGLSFYQEILNNSQELRTWWCYTPVPQRARKTPAPNLSQVVSKYRPVIV